MSVTSRKNQVTLPVEALRAAGQSLVTTFGSKSGARAVSSWYGPTSSSRSLPVSSTHARPRIAPVQASAIDSPTASIRFAYRPYCQRGETSGSPFRIPFHSCSRWPGRAASPATAPGMLRSRPALPLPAVDLSTVSDAGDQHEAFAVVDCVDDPVVADADPVVVAPRELARSRRSWIASERVDCCGNATAKRVMESAEGTSRLRVEADLVRPVAHGFRGRTSDHGTASPRSSRAWRAARLSSR